MSDVWDPAQYHRYSNERRQPFFDLLGLMHPAPKRPRVVDLGCGTGELTKTLHEGLAASETIGIDSSDAMLEKATRLVGAGLTFEKGDFTTYGAPESFDVVFSNAALQWADGHPALLARLARCLRPGGQLGVQVPANHDTATHFVASRVAAEEPFRSDLVGYHRESPVLAPEHYARILNHLGFEDQHVRLQVYLHRLPSRDDVVEWVKGTLLTDYQKRLSPPRFEAFLARYREALMDELEDMRPYPFAFKRILFWGRLPVDPQ